MYPFTKIHAFVFFLFLFPSFSFFFKIQSRTLLDLALKVLALNQVGDIIVILALLASLLHVLVALGQLAEGGQGVGAELVQDAGDKLGELLILTVAVDGESVGLNGGVDCKKHVMLVCGLMTPCVGLLSHNGEEEPTLGSGKVDDVAVGLEHVDLLDGLDGLSVELLQLGLELLVIGVGSGGSALGGSSGSSLSTVSRKQSQFLEFKIDMSILQAGRCIMD